jgi:long-chain acyl-CoA synthetase
VTHLDWLEQQARLAGPRPALALHGDAAEAFSYEQLWRASLAGGRGLRAAGVHPGDRVALLSESRPRWALALLAIWQADATAVPLDPRLEADELRRVLRDARPCLVLASAGQLGLAQRLADGVSVLGLEEGEAWLADAPAAGAATQAVTAPAMTDTALIVYTSGTGGEPKGVMLSHANIAFQLRMGARLFTVDEHMAAVSVLPLNHIFELTVGLLSVLHGGGRVRYCASLLPADIAVAMQAQKVTAMAVVPLFLTLLQRGIERELRQGPQLRRAAFRAACMLARALPWAGARRRLFAGLHRRFGGRLRFFICGGAALPMDVAQFFDTLGIAVYQGYGLTEASPIVSTNHPGANRPGSVGRPLPGVEVRCVPPAGGQADQHRAGEIETRGPHVMQGYFGLPELTAASIDAEGWLRTGDLGHVDADGYLFVRGRSDNLLVLGSGKKVSAEEVEQHLAREPGFREVAVLGRIAATGPLRGTHEVCAVVVPDDTLARDTGDGDLQVRVVEAVRRRSAGLAAFKRPTRVVVHRDEFPKTTSRKIRRPQLAAWLDTLDANDARGAD